MKKIAILASVLAIAGCTDATVAYIGAYGDTAEITCWSGGEVVFTDTSTGKVADLEGNGLGYKSASTQKYVRVYADCIVKN